MAGTGIGAFRSFAPALGDAFSVAAAGGRKLYGFAEHSVTSTFLGSSSGLRLRHDQPAGQLEINAKSAEHLAALPLTLRNDSWAPGLECAPFVIAHASGRDSSVYDNGLPLAPTDWISGEKLAGLTQTRHSAQRVRVDGFNMSSVSQASQRLRRPPAGSRP